MKVGEFIEYQGSKYRYLGNGPKAAGSKRGWVMSKNNYFRCVSCGYLMNGDDSITDNCTCGDLHKDSGYCRFGSRLGDNAIEVFEKV
ncbi:MAG: hypothetical protein FWD58_04395 [Firmicutes bacterium]|nr:hypothetical protein [Bacillota bacterium]